MFSSNRSELRKTYFTAWQKHLKGSPLEALDSQIIDIILLHPEYHAMLSDSDAYQDHDFGESNPFLHMSLHLAIRDQIRLNRPTGILSIYQELCVKYQDSVRVEHLMIDCLADILWNAQQNNQPPDEKNYLETLKKL